MEIDKPTPQRLAFYLGCDLKTPKGIERFVGINLESKQYQVITLQKGMSITNAYKISDVEPMLRHLTSITDQEAIEIANLVSDYECGSPDWVIERGNTCIKLKDGHYSVTIFTYEVMVSFKYEDEEQQIDNKAELITYLLLKHIDIFSWIEDLLAIDKNKPE